MQGISEINNAVKQNDAAFRRSPNFYKEPEKLQSKYGRIELISISRGLYRNEGIVKGAIELKATHSLTNAFTYKARHDEAEDYNQYVNNWYKIACVNGDNFQNLLYQVSVAIDVDGDCFILLTKTKTGFPKLQLLRANRVAYPFDEVKEGKYKGFPCLDGVIIEKNTGREVAYVIDNEKVIDAASIIHCRDVDYLSGSRGTPLFAHSVRNWRFFQDVNESELHAAKIASQIALVEHNETGDSGDEMDIYSNPTANGNETSIRDFGNGTIRYFSAASGSRIESLKFERPSINYLNFVKQLILSSLAGVGIPYSIVLTSESNSVASRVDMAKFDKEILSRYELLSEIAKKAVEYVLAVAIERGDLPHVKNWWNMSFSRCPKASLNWSRDINADIALYNAGLKSLSEFADERGLTLDEFLNEKAKDYQKVKEIAESKNIPLSHFGIVESESNTNK